jgi:misacylated tRNA(Ala) deacylase
MSQLHRKMTEKLCWNDPYMRTFEARVTSVDGTKVILDKSAFYPRGGGLISDVGQLEGIRVTEVVKGEDGESIVHVLVESPHFAIGDVVRGEIDWVQRYKMMKLHTAAHILSAIVHKEAGALITGNQLTPSMSRIDLSLENFDREKLSDYVAAANAVVTRGVDVKTYFMKREEALATPGLVKLANALPPSVAELRIVQIGDVDTQADGGVHVANTREIGEIVIDKAENKGKSNRRVYFSLK